MTKSAVQLDREIAEYLADKEKATRRRKPTRVTLPRFDMRKKVWVGGDSRTLYAFTGDITGEIVVRPGWPGRVLLNEGPGMTVRVATRDEAERLWQNPLHPGWTVA